MSLLTYTWKNDVIYRDGSDGVRLYSVSVNEDGIYWWAFNKMIRMMTGECDSVMSVRLVDIRKENEQ